MAEVKFPTEVVDLPSKGLLYPKDSSLSSGQIEIKYMTAKEEDILTSANLIKRGLVVQKLLESLIELNPPPTSVLSIPTHTPYHMQGYEPL